MSFNVVIQYERTGDKATQKPSDVVSGVATFGDAVDVVDMVDEITVERVTIERTA